MNRVLGIIRSRVGRVAIAAGVVTAAVLGFAAPAYAHHSVLHGSTTCYNSDNVVSWSIQAVSVANLPMTIASANATIGNATFAVTGYTPTINNGDTTYATTTVPYGTSGTITLHVHSTWPDGVTYDDSTSVELISDCTTTTTATTTTTTTTTTTSTTMPPPTTTTEAPTTTTEAPTTTTIGEQGSTSTLPPTTTTEAPTTTTQPPTCMESTTTTTIGEQVSTSVPVTVPETTAPTSTTQPCTESTTTTAATTTTTIGEQASTSVPVTVPPTTTPTPSTSPPTPPATTPVSQQDTPTSAAVPISGSLPRTGGDSGFPLVLGAGCVGVGGVLALRRRRAWSR